MGINPIFFLIYLQPDSGTSWTWPIITCTTLSVLGVWISFLSYIHLPRLQTSTNKLSLMLAMANLFGVLPISIMKAYFNNKYSSQEDDGEQDVEEEMYVTKFDIFFGWLAIFSVIAQSLWPLYIAFHLYANVNIFYRNSDKQVNDTITSLSMLEKQESLRTKQIKKTLPNKLCLICEKYTTKIFECIFYSLLCPCCCTLNKCKGYEGKVKNSGGYDRFSRSESSGSVSSNSSSSSTKSKKNYYWPKFINGNVYIIIGWLLILLLSFIPFLISKNIVDTNEDGDTFTNQNLILYFTFGPIMFSIFFGLLLYLLIFWKMYKEVNQVRILIKELFLTQEDNFLGSPDSFPILRNNTCIRKKKLLNPKMIIPFFLMHLILLLCYGIPIVYNSQSLIKSFSENQDQSNLPSWLNVSNFDIESEKYDKTQIMTLIAICLTLLQGFSTGMIILFNPRSFQAWYKFLCTKERQHEEDLEETPCYYDELFEQIKIQLYPKGKNKYNVIQKRNSGLFGDDDDDDMDFFFDHDEYDDELNFQHYEEEQKSKLLEGKRRSSIVNFGPEIINIDYESHKSRKNSNRIDDSITFSSANANYNRIYGDEYFRNEFSNTSNYNSNENNNSYASLI